MPARLHVLQSVGSAFPAPQVETTDRELPELLMPLGAQDEHSARILHITLIALSAVMLGVILWASFAQISDVASATGTLEPTAHKRRIEHIDGGQVARLMVREGDKVSAGQPLMELDGAQAAGAPGQEGDTLELQSIKANVLLKRALARTDRLTVRSPVDGVVKVVPVSPGSVVPPGGLLAVVVPTDDKLVVEAQIPSSEMRDLRTGLAAHVRIASFGLPGKGWIDGTVLSVSPSSFANDQGQRFYKMRIVLDDTSLSPAIARDLSPGLEAHADIVTGHKSVLAFLVSPVRHGLASALTEK